MLFVRVLRRAILTPALAVRKYHRILSPSAVDHLSPVLPRQLPCLHLAPASLPLSAHWRHSMARSRRTVVTASVQVHAAMVAVKPELEVKPDFEVVEAIESAGASPDGHHCIRMRWYIQLPSATVCVSLLSCKSTNMLTRFLTVVILSRGRSSRIAGTEIASVESGAAMMSDGVVDTPSRAKGDPKAEYLPAHPGISARATDLPLPSLGYACLNCTLRHSKPTFFNNRTCRLATIQDPKKVRRK